MLVLHDLEINAPDSLLKCTTGGVKALLGGRGKYLDLDEGVNTHQGRYGTKGGTHRLDGGVTEALFPFLRIKSPKFIVWLLAAEETEEIVCQRMEGHTITNEVCRT